MKLQCLAKPNFAEAAERLEAWWSGSSMGRPAVTCTNVRRPDAPPPPEDSRTDAERDMDPQWHLACARWQLEGGAFPAETMPGLYPRFAANLAIPSVLAGGVLDYRVDTACCRCRPCWTA